MKSTYLFSFILLLFVAFSCSKADDVIDEGGTTPPKTEESEEITEYNPGNANDIEKDIAVIPVGGKDSEHQDGEDITKSFDGDQSTLFHTPWYSDAQYPVELEYFFTDEEFIDYIVLYPRTDGNNNGWIKKATLYVQTEGDQKYQKVAEYEFKENNTPKIIRFKDGLENPTAIKLSVTEGINEFVSLAEIEFYKNSGAMTEYLDIFEDKAATTIKAGVSRQDIEDLNNEFIKQMALAIYEDVYDDFRIGEFQSYPDPNVIATSNKTSTHGLLDNATGIYIKWGTEMVVFMEDFEGDISLRVLNHNQGYGASQDFVLQPGANRFTVNTEGLAYLMYQDENEHHVKANFATGKINGYFDVSKHTNADWNNLINNAEYDYFDVLGELAMLSFTTGDLRQYTPDIEELIGLYDDIVHLQQDFLGLYKYDREYTTRAYYRTNVDDPNMYMYATAYRTEYNKGTMSAIADPATLRSTPWGPAHETGHVHQTRPGLLWHGLTEVTTNIYAQYVQTEWGNPARLDDEDMGQYNNRYEKGFTVNLYRTTHPAIEDVFVKLIPFWQLQLYFSNVLGEDDFYKDVHEYIRTHDDPPTAGEQQVNFVKITSDIAKKDLSDFFIAWGFLSPTDQNLDDYGDGNIKVTQAMIDEAVNYVSKYPKPDAKIEYLNEQNIAAYRNKGSVTAGSAAISGNSVSISGSSNVAAFEVERGGEIVFISPRSSFTVSSLGSGDKIYAVGYNGDRKEVN